VTSKSPPTAGVRISVQRSPVCTGGGELPEGRNISIVQNHHFFVSRELKENGRAEGAPFARRRSLFAMTTF